MRSSTPRPAFSGLAQAYRRLRRDVDAVRRILGRNASKWAFRALAGVNRVALKTEEQIGPSEVVWSDCGQEVVNMARPCCNRELPELIEKRIGCYTLTNCFLHVNHRVMLIPPGPIPFEEGNKLLAYALKPEHYRNPFVHVPLSALLRSLSGGAHRNAPTLRKACLLTNAWNRTYHHWVTELLPQIVILEKAGVACGDDDMKFVIPPSPARWQLESLELMRIPSAALVCVDAPTRVEQLFIPSFARREVVGGGWSILSPRILTRLRDRIHTQCDVDTMSRPSLKIYISRRLALGRQVINEEELEQALTRMGFRVVVAETMSYAEEVRVFANARIIVGPTGSGLSNVIFCRGQAKVVEISAHEKGCEYPGSTDYSLSTGLGHEFSVYLAKPVRRLAPARFDLKVDVEDFCRFLTQSVV